MPDHPVQVVSLLLVGVGVIGMVWRLEVSEQDEQKAQDRNRALQDERKRKPPASPVVKVAKAWLRLGEWRRAKMRG